VKRNENQPAKLTRKYAKFIANSRLRSRQNVALEVQTNDAKVTSLDIQAEQKRRAERWAMIGKAILAIFGLAITIAGLIFAHGDSRLEIVGGKQQEVRGHSASGKSYTFLVVVYCTFRNSGVRSDYIRHIDIQPADLDKTVNSEPKFVDTRSIAWRQTMDLRFEILVTTEIGTGPKHFFLTFYDSKGRQVGQLNLTTKFMPPVPRAMVLPNTGASQGAIARPKSIPTLRRITLSGAVPEAIRDPRRRYFVTFVTADGVVLAQSDPGGVVERNGRIDISIDDVLLVPTEGNPALLKVWTDPPRHPWLAFEMELMSEWSDGTRILDVITPPPPKKSPVASGNL